jgi:hypothetical protein
MRMSLSLPSLSVAGMLACLGLLTGCPKTGSADAASAAVTPGASQLTTSTTADGLVEVKVDLDHDGKPEITNYFKERADGPRLLVRKETDLNRDGKVDVRTQYDESGRRKLEEMDGDFDGRSDWADHYIDGKRTYSEVDTNFDGTYDLYKYYEGGKVRRKERDTNGDGKIDVWEYLDEAGKVIKTGRDTNGDGKMDHE